MLYFKMPSNQIWNLQSVAFSSTASKETRAIRDKKLPLNRYIGDNYSRLLQTTSNYYRLLLTQPANKLKPKLKNQPKAN
jgi:hypothetical protein